MSSLANQSLRCMSRDEYDDDSIVLFAQEEGRTVNKTHSYDSEKTGELTGSDVDEQQNDEMSALLRSAAHYGGGYNTAVDNTDRQSAQVAMTRPPYSVGIPHSREHSRVRSLAARSKWKRIASSVDGMLIEPGSSSSLEQHREAVLNDFRKGMDFTLTQCLIAVVFYMGVAVAAFSFIFDHFTVIDACYFAVVTFTTIGYGDLVPDSSGGRLFTCFFALTGVACLGIALGVIGNNIIETQEKAMSKASGLKQSNAMSLFSREEPPETTTAAAAKFVSTSEEESPRDRILWEFSMVIVLLVLFALLLADDPGVEASGWWQLGDALYYAVISASTVGYGDMAPKTQRGRLVAVFAIPLAVGVMGHWLSYVASYIMRQKQDDSMQRRMQKELTMADLEIMDQDCDGTVSQLEFLEFMLVAMNKVDKETLQSLREYFTTLDVDCTGELSKNDLVLRAKTRLRRTSRKLELSTYKQQLLRKASPSQRRRRSIWLRTTQSENAL